MTNIDPRNFRDRKLVFIDFETTGLLFDTHEIIEVGVIVADGRSYKKEIEYSDKIKPCNLDNADKEALEIVGYSKEAWKNAKEALVVLNKVSELAPGGMLVGWNISFDWVFLEKALNKYSIKHKYHYHKLDVAAIVYSKLFKNEKFKSLSLRSAANYYGIDMPKKHDALSDIKATYEIFIKLMS